jgi:hypothetical protein
LSSWIEGALGDLDAGKALVIIAHKKSGHEKISIVPAVKSSFILPFADWAYPEKVALPKLAEIAARLATLILSAVTAPA